MIEFVNSPTSPEDQPAALAVQWNPDPMQVSVGINRLDACLILSDYAEVLGAQVQYYLSEIGRVVSDEFAKPESNSAHDIEFTDRVLGEMILNAIAEQVHVDEQSFYVHLERGSTNRLIRLLRKARDSAFGRDE